MQYMGLIKANSTACLPPSPGLMEKMGKLMEEITGAGVSFATHGLEPKLNRARVKFSAGQFTVASEPSTESKEPGAPYAIFDVESIGEAIQWAKCFLQVLGEGECEIRSVADNLAVC
jgi:hypothetical protein